MDEQLQPYDRPQAPPGSASWGAPSAQPPSLQQPYQSQPYPSQPYPSQPTGQLWGQAPAGHGMLATDQRAYGGWVAVAWIVAFFTFAYTLPTAVAASRGKANTGAICVVNVLAGWTIIGWIASLVLACGSHQMVHLGATQHVVIAQQFAPAQMAPPAAWYPAPDGNGQQYWDGRTWTGHRAP